MENLGDAHMVRKVAVTRTDLEGTLRRDLEKYSGLAIKLGASDVKIISTNIIRIDERVRAKCIVPKCDWYGTNPNCPPYVPDVNFWRETIRKYQYGIIFKLDVPVKDLVDTKRSNISRVKIQKITSKLESEAFYDGYYFALGLGSGPCITTFCKGEKCTVLTQGPPCKHALRSRIAMEGIGIDVFSLAAELGWDTYPIGRKTPQPFPPCGIRAGLVLIA